MAEGINYTVKDGEDGRKIRIATDASSNQLLDVTPLPPKPLSAKAKSRHRRK
jgi:hypothetical protein